MPVHAIAVLCPRSVRPLDRGLGPVTDEGPRALIGLSYLLVRNEIADYFTSNWNISHYDLRSTDTLKMGKKTQKPEEILSERRHVDVLGSRGQNTAMTSPALRACREVGAFGFRWTCRSDERL